MRCSVASLVLATLAFGQSLAASISHPHSAVHAHARKHAHSDSQPQKRDAAITDADLGRLAGLSVIGIGANSYVPNGAAWLGADGAYKNEFVNESGQDLILVIWGPAGSWVNVIQPTITATVPANTSLWVSFADGASGAWTAVYPDTTLVNGQLSNTWGEFTFGQWGVVDVSREVNMNGHYMSITGPSCVTNMDTCVFICPDNQPVCMYGYILLNCENGSQPGANYGIHEGAPSGGCGGMGAAATLRTVLG